MTFPVSVKANFTHSKAPKSLSFRHNEVGAIEILLTPALLLRMASNTSESYSRASSMAPAAASPIPGM